MKIGTDTYLIGVPGPTTVTMKMAYESFLELENPRGRRYLFLSEMN